MPKFAIPKVPSTLTTIARKGKRKLKYFNEYITCSICMGYLIEATTINDCLHSFCRSCIVKHLLKYEYCPVCKSNNRPVQLQHLRPDPHLKAIVYKLVSGLHNSEQKRIEKFCLEQGIDSTLIGASHEKSIVSETVTKEDAEKTEFYYSADDPISLSLEYHPTSVMEYDASLVPPIRYLQCPAAVSIRHLKRFLSSKFNLSLDSSIVDIQIIYDDEVLPVTLTLMDVAYCYNWNRLNPMRFYYQVFVNDANFQSNANKINIKLSDDDANITTTDRNNINNIKNMELNEMCNIKYNMKNELNDDKKITILTEEHISQYNTNIDDDDNNENIESDDKIQKLCLKSLVKLKNLKSSDCFTSSSTTSSNFKSLRSNDVKYNNNPTNYVAVVDDDDDDDVLKNDKPKLTDCKTTSKTQAKIVPHNDSKQYNINNGLGNNNVNCKKEEEIFLHSFDDEEEVTDSKNDQNDEDDDNDKFKNKTENYHQQVDKFCIIAKNKTNDIGSSLQLSPRISSPNIIVTIPNQNRRNSSCSDETIIDNLAQLKTANVKKYKISPTSNQNSFVTEHLTKNLYNVSNDEQFLEKNNRKNVPKLKIELSRLKPSVVTDSTTFYIRNDADESKEQKLLYRQQTVDKTEYAEKIGLKPIKNVDTIIQHKIDNNDDASSLYHKKRKKSGKHSKESGSVKRRKLHAEISSQEEESLKLKVKITANKPSKHHERKTSSSSLNGSDEQPIIKPDTSIVKDKLSDLRQVRHKPISSTISSPPSASTTPSLSKIVAPQPHTTTKIYSPTSTAVSSLTNIFTKNTTTYVNTNKLNTQSNPNISSSSTTYVPNNSTIFSSPKPKPSTIYTQANSSNNNHLMPNTVQFKRPADVLHQTQKTIKLAKPITVTQLPNLKHISSLTTKAVTQSLPKTIKPPTTEPLYYNSEMSSTYTKEIVTKKPLPMLLPPSSISVTKMTDLTVNPIQTTANQRPALEIVRISSTVPAIDQQPPPLNQKPQIPIKPKPQIAGITKAIRPLPQTIPLVKIKTAATNMSNKLRIDEKMSKHVEKMKYSPLDLSPRNLSSPEPAPLIIDITSSKSERSSMPTDSKLIPKPIVQSRDDKTDQRLLNLKLLSDSALAREKLSVTSAPPLLSTNSLIQQRHLLIPKLNEITKLQKTIQPITVRQQNASVRNIPNPSALAFRNQSITAQKSYGKNVAMTLPTTTNTFVPKSFNSNVYTNTTINHKSEASNSSMQFKLKPQPTTLAMTTSSSNNFLSTNNSLIFDSMKKNTLNGTPTTIPSLSSSSSMATILKDFSLPTTTTFLSKSPSVTSSSNNDAKLIAAKKNLHIEQLAATLRTTAAAAKCTTTSTTPINKNIMSSNSSSGSNNVTSASIATSIY